MVTSTTSTTNANTNLASAGSSLVSKLGNGSGVDSSSLINQLVEISQSAQATRLTSKKTDLETQISDFGLMRSAISKLNTAVTALGNPDTFNAKAVSIPDTSLLTINKIDAKAVAGDYRIKVESVAQAQSLSSGVFATSNAAIGKGTVTLRLGSWNAALDTFTADTTKTGATITIDDTNNTLEGLRDAINKANVGVQASIVNDGSGYKLLLTGPSGEKNEMELTVAEDGSSPGLSAFNFNETNQGFTQEQEGLDAQVRVNGLLLNRESNHLTDVIPGLEFDIFNSSATEQVTINISQDKSTAEQVIRDFVSAYNTFLSDTDKLMGKDADTGEYGSLHQDPLAKSLVSAVRSALATPITGSSSAFNTLGTLGIRTQLDGTLQIVEDSTNTSFTAAINNHFDEVRDFFAPKYGSDNAKITVKTFGAASKAGSYAVNITTQAAKGYLNGGALSGVSFPLDTTGKDYSFKIKINDVESNTVTIPAGKVYNTADEMAADIQSLVNLDTNIKAAKGSVSVTYNSTDNRFEFVSNDYGSNSKVAISEVGVDLGDLGLSVATGVTGVDVAGTIDGVAGFGYGNVLLPKLGSAAEGLQMIVDPGASSGTITFSRGFSSQVVTLLDSYTKSSGLIKGRETTINKDITQVKEDQTTLQRRTDAYRSRLQAQFLAMENIVRSLNATSNSLDNIMKVLPFTASSGN